MELTFGGTKFAVLSKLYIDGKIKLGNVLGPLYGRMEMDKKYIYHRATCNYDPSNIVDSLGFEGIHLYDWRETEHAHFDDHSRAYPTYGQRKRTLISLNVECVKVTRVITNLKKQYFFFWSPPLLLLIITHVLSCAKTSKCKIVLYT